MTRIKTIDSDGSVIKKKTKQPCRRRKPAQTPGTVISWKRGPRENLHQRHRDKTRSIKAWTKIARERGGGVGLKYPKLKKEKPDNGRLLKEWKHQVARLDGYPTRCIVPAGICDCHQPHDAYTLSPHHILSRARYPKLKYNPEIGISLGAGCHRAAHHGTVKDGKRISADRFMEIMLKSLRRTDAWRWDMAWEILKGERK